MAVQLVRGKKWPRSQAFILAAIVALSSPALSWLGLSMPALAQIPPTTTELASYDGLHKAAAEGDVALLRTLIASAADLNSRDAKGRTAWHVAAFQKQRDAMRLLAGAGLDVNSLEHQAYDAVTIASVADDVETLKVALALGNKPGNVTSPYDGTALIAAAHLGHEEIVQILIEAGAPRNHVNNLGWTALIEAVILGDGGPRHQAVVKQLLDAGADRSFADRNGITPLEYAKQRGFSFIIALFEK